MAKISAKPALGALDATSVILANKGGVTGRHTAADLSRAAGHVLRVQQINVLDNSLELTLAAGSMFVSPTQELSFRAKYDRPLGPGMSILFAPIVNEARPLVYADGSQIDNGAWLAEQELRVVYNPTGPHAGKYQLLSPLKAPANKSFFAPLVEQAGSGSNMLILGPVAGASLPNNTGSYTRFQFRVAINQGEGGMTVRIIGINDADPLQLRLADQIGQIPDGTLKAGDVIEFLRTPSAHYHLAEPLPAAASVGTALSKYDTIAIRGAQQNAAQAVSIARKAAAL